MLDWCTKSFLKHGFQTWESTHPDSFDLMLQHYTSYMLFFKTVPCFKTFAETTP